MNPDINANTRRQWEAIFAARHLLKRLRREERLERRSDRRLFARVRGFVEEKRIAALMRERAMLAGFIAEIDDALNARPATHTDAP